MLNDIKSLKLNLMAHPDNEENSEFADRISDLEDIEKYLEDTETMTVQEIIDNPEKSPLPLEVIPNQMGINLVSVEYISWKKQDDGQLINLTINFMPSN